MINRALISKWFDEGIELGASHMIIICDMFDCEEYHIYCGTKGEVEDIIKNPGDMQKIMEIYKLSEPKRNQLSSHRCYRL